MAVLGKWNGPRGGGAKINGVFEDTIELSGNVSKGDVVAPLAPFEGSATLTLPSSPLSGFNSLKTIDSIKWNGLNVWVISGATSTPNIAAYIETGVDTGAFEQISIASEPARNYNVKLGISPGGKLLLALSGDSYRKLQMRVYNQSTNTFETFASPNGNAYADTYSGVIPFDFHIINGELHFVMIVDSGYADDPTIHYKLNADESTWTEVSKDSFVTGMTSRRGISVTEFENEGYMIFITTTSPKYFFYKLVSGVWTRMLDDTSYFSNTHEGGKFFIRNSELYFVALGGGGTVPYLFKLNSSKDKFMHQDLVKPLRGTSSNGAGIFTLAEFGNDLVMVTGGDTSGSGDSHYYVGDKYAVEVSHGEQTNFSSEGAALIETQGKKFALGVSYSNNANVVAKEVKVRWSNIFNKPAFDLGTSDYYALYSNHGLGVAKGDGVAGDIINIDRIY